MHDLQYISGDVSLDFVNTVDWTGDGAVNERLTSYEQLVRWARGAGLISRAETKRTALRTALRVRAVLQRLFSTLARGRIDPAALAALNRLHRIAARRRVLVVSNRKPRWQWCDDSILWPIVWAASNLIASDDANDIRVCGGPACGWMFVDRSRNHLRRWCRMETCGTREKTRKRRGNSTSRER